MKNISIEERAVKLAHYIIESKDTVRGAAKRYGISKSTVHTDVSALQKNKIPEYIELPQVSKDSVPVRVSIAVRM
jgi:putative DeoR family transcriptional regulator (stage III sporulation protein D)